MRCDVLRGAASSGRCASQRVVYLATVSPLPSLVVALAAEANDAADALWAAASVGFGDLGVERDPIGVGSHRRGSIARASRADPS